MRSTGAEPAIGRTVSRNGRGVAPGGSNVTATTPAGFVDGAPPDGAALAGTGVVAGTALVSVASVLAPSDEQAPRRATDAAPKATPTMARPRRGRCGCRRAREDRAGGS